MKKESWYKELRQASPENRFWTRGTKTNVSIALIIVSILLSAGLLQATRTITDTSDVWTGTNVWQGNVDFESGVYFNLSKKIVNSKGHVYNATFANLQDAIDDVGNDTGWISLAPTTYTVTSTLNIWNHTTIMGNGAVLKLGAAANCAVVGINMKAGAGGSANDGRHDILIENLKIWGNNASQTWNQYYVGIGITGNCHNITIRNVDINNTCTDGIWIYSIASQTGAKHITIDDCTVSNIECHLTDYPGGVYLGSSFSRVINCDFINCWGSGVIFENWNFPQYCHNNLAQGNTITGVTSTGIWWESAKGHNNTAIGNHIYNLNSSCYLASATVYSRALVMGQDDGIASLNTIENVTDMAIVLGYDRNIVSDNRIMNLAGGAHASKGVAILPASGAQYYTISGNHISKYTTYGISVFATAGTHAVINGNTFIGGSRAISVSTGCNNITISNNICLDQSSDGIMLYACKNITVTGNRCKTSGDGIQATGTCINVNIVGNNCLGSTTPFNYAACTGSILSYNLGYFTVQLPTSAPATAEAGMMYVNTTTGDIAVYSGTAWIWTHG